MKSKRIKVLGTDYTLAYKNEMEEPKLKECDGFCDFSVKECVVDSIEVKDLMNMAQPQFHKAKIARHEIVHAFLYESGLRNASGWADNEEMVEWIAVQMPKLAETMIRAGVL